MKRALPRKEVIGGQNFEGLPFSEAIRLGNLVFVSGMVGTDESGRIVPGGIGPETRQTFLNIERVLKEAGCSLDDVVKVNVVLADSKDFEGYNAVYKDLFRQAPPARVTTAAQLTIDARLEADVIAGVGAGLKARPTARGRDIRRASRGEGGKVGGPKKRSVRQARTRRSRDGRELG